MQGTGRYLRVPDQPLVPIGRPSFECPYCHAQLNVHNMRKRQSWKKHVFRDLRQYMCTYEGCLNAEKMYVTRHDWMYHEGQLHQRSWICQDQCNCKFPSPQLLKQHMLDCHSGTFTESQLPILTDMCERPASPDERASCPLCGEEATLKALRTHVALHLEDVALFVLPIPEDDQNADANSHHAEQPCEKDNRFDDDELSSLGSLREDEAALALPQDPEAFGTAWKTGGEYSLPNVGDWLSVGRKRRADEEERQDTVQADFHLDTDANRWQESERLGLIDRVDARESQRQFESSPTSLVSSPVLKRSKSEEEEPQMEFGIPAFLCQSQSALRARFNDLAWREKLRILQGRNDPSSQWLQDPGPSIAARNRYGNVQPWDKSRVRLKVAEGQSDYINASPRVLRDSRTDIETEFIATQGPIRSSTNDFWHMTWQETTDVAVIAMLTQTHEEMIEKCFQYFPLSVDAGSFKIEPEGSVTVLEHYLREDMRTEVRKLSLKFGIETKDVWHFLFLSWPDFTIPEDPSALVKLIKLSAETNTLPSNSRIIHCSAGVGRTGTFNALEYLLAQVDLGAIFDAKDDKDIIYDVVNHLREQRMLMVQTEGQYQFLYEIIRDQVLERHPQLRHMFLTMSMPLRILLPIHRAFIPRAILANEAQLSSESARVSEGMKGPSAL